MGLIKIEYGSLASSDTINTNFTYLDNRINESGEGIVSLQNSLASMNSTLNRSIEGVKNELLQIIYPVGSIYIGITVECPISALLGTWEKVAEGRVLQGSDSIHEAGSTISAGLPNITGRFSAENIGTYQTGAFAQDDETFPRSTGSGAAYYKGYNFDASRSSAVYGNSDTVQPPAFVVNIWRRVA